jgi:hypothetical protein
MSIGCSAVRCAPADIKKPALVLGINPEINGGPYDRLIISKSDMPNGIKKLKSVANRAQLRQGDFSGNGFHMSIEST